MASEVTAWQDINGFFVGIVIDGAGGRHTVPGGPFATRGEAITAAKIHRRRIDSGAGYHEVPATDGTIRP